MALKVSSHRCRPFRPPPRLGCRPLLRLGLALLLLLHLAVEPRQALGLADLREESTLVSRLPYNPPYNPLCNKKVEGSRAEEWPRQPLGLADQALHDVADLARDLGACRGTWARVTADQFRHSALQTC